MAAILLPLRISNQVPGNGARENHNITSSAVTAVNQQSYTNAIGVNVFQTCEIILL